MRPLLRSLLVLPMLAVSACAPAPAENGAAAIQDPSTASEVGVVEVGRYSINGDTPTVAWSPDGKRLAVADSISSAPTIPIADRDYGAIAILDFAQGEEPVVRPAYLGDAYHPVWIDDATLAFCVSPAEAGNESEMGIYTLDVGPDARSGAPRHVARVPAYRTLRAAQPGKVLYWAGWPEEPARWRLLDVATGESEDYAGASQQAAASSGTPPADAWVDQSPERAGGLSVRASSYFAGVEDSQTRTIAQVFLPAMNTRD